MQSKALRLTGGWDIPTPVAAPASGLGCEGAHLRAGSNINRTESKQGALEAWSPPHLLSRAVTPMSQTQEGSLEEKNTWTQISSVVTNTAPPALL